MGLFFTHHPRSQAMLVIFMNSHEFAIYLQRRAGRRTAAYVGD